MGDEMYQITPLRKKRDRISVSIRSGRIRTKITLIEQRNSYSVSIKETTSQWRVINECPFLYNRHVIDGYIFWNIEEDKIVSFLSYLSSDLSLENCI
jgi:hypothetical protein